MSMSNVQLVNEEMERLWNAYVEARNVVETSNHIKDGIAAGMAWKAFLDVFLDDTHTEKMPDGSPSGGV